MTTLAERGFLMPGRAAARLGVTVHALRDWADAGLIPVVKTVGGQRRYRTADVDAFVAPSPDDPRRFALRTPAGDLQVLARPGMSPTQVAVVALGVARIQAELDRLAAA